MSHHGCPERLSNMGKGYAEDGSGQGTMEVLVETLTGTAFEMTVSPSDTVFAIKSKIFRVEGIPVAQQHLVYNLQELEDARSLHELSIRDGARLRLVLGLRGGPVASRRLPPPAAAEPWRDIERLLDTNREDGDWGGASSSSSGNGSGCKVTVLVFRDGERVNMLRVRENRDGTYEPIDTAKYTSSLTQLVECGCGEGAGGGGTVAGSSAGGGAGGENALTMSKMMELRTRMNTLSLRRSHNRTDKADIQKTRSEETLSVPSLLDEPDYNRTYTPYSEAEDTFAVYDGNYTRYDYGSYTLLPPIGRADSEQSVQDDERIKLSDTLAGSILVQGRRDDESILEECLDSSSVDDCHIRQEAKLTKDLAPISTADYGAAGSVVCGGGAAWVGRRFGSSSALFPRRAPAPLSASEPELRPLPPHSPAPPSLPSLTRAAPRDLSALSDERLDSPHLRPLPNVTVTKHTPPVEDKKKRVRCCFCRKRLSVATLHRCRCGSDFCAPHRYAEVHGCAYDYKAEARSYLQQANPLVSAPKLPKI